MVTFDLLKWPISLLYGLASLKRTIFKQVMEKNKQNQTIAQKEMKLKSGWSLLIFKHILCNLKPKDGKSLFFIPSDHEETSEI